ncbi:helix-turn-helix transcriptional regulator [Thermaerobacter marianensis]|uniref:helix-turn-helix transcriptional regulator n=1 Tax=Thermaerobacter marianensis TaxID=73919 RepID=UPI0002F6FE65|nr:helix-turn-helix transcriptional regulator [Thermaerobacter marianensis]
MAIGRMMAEARQRAGLTQEQAAPRLAVSRRALAYYEAGERTPPPEVVRAAARAYQAPELLVALAGETPLVGVAMEDDPLEAVGWLREELREALEAAERAEAMLRRGEPTPEVDEQIYDLTTALASYLVARGRQGLDLEALARQHRRKIADRYLRRHRPEGVAA